MKTLTGRVLSNKQQQTVVVEISRLVKHRLYKKTITRHRKLKAHTNETLNIGDVVEIVQTRPISKDKHYKVVKVVKKTASL